MFKKRKIDIAIYLILLWVLIGITLSMVWVGISLSRNSEKAILMMIEKDIMAIAASYSQSFHQLYSAQQMEENLLKVNALTIAHMIDHIPDISDILLSEIALENQLARIDKLDSFGRVITSSSPDLEVPYYPGLKFIISGRRNELIIWATDRVDSIIGIPFRNYKLAAIRSEDGGAIVVYLSEGYVNSILFHASVSRLVKEAGTSPGMAYIALQNFDGIVSASGRVEQLTKIENDMFLQEVIRNQIPEIRKSIFKGNEIYEVVSPLSYQGFPWGVIRIGFYLSDYNQMITNYKQRIFLMLFFSWIALLLILVVGILGFRYLSLKRELYSIETMTAKLVDSSNYGIFIVDNDLKIIQINQYGLNMFGLGSSQVKRVSYDKLFAEDELYISRTWRMKREIKDSLQKLKFSDGKEEEFLIDTLLLKENGNPVGVVSFLKEFKHVKIERELKAEKEKLREISEITTTIAHELRNPLNGISLAVQRIKKEFDIEKNEELSLLIDILSKETVALEKKLSNLLVFAKPISTEGTSINIVEIIKDLVNIYDTPKIKITTTKEKIIITGDKSYLYRLFDNLIDNAKKAMAKSLIITIDYKDETVFISVKDDGLGISKKYLKDIFKPYFSTSPTGTGLGLYIVKRIVTEYNGTINVRSEENRGTEFSIVLRK